MIQRTAVDASSIRPQALAASMAERIHAGREEAETFRRMPAWLADELREAGAYRLFTPRELGGHELSLTEAVEVFEQLGYVDAPTAWNVWNGNIGFAAALLDEEAVATVWPDGADPILCNSARPAGTASAEGDGFRLSGRWDIVSGVDNADWVTLFGIVMDGPAPRLVGGAPDIRVFILPREDVQILDTWHTAGMRGTGSNTVVVDGAFVPGHLAISPFAPTRIDRPTYRIPAFTLASTGAAPIVVGATQAAIDEVLALAPTKGTDNGQLLADRPHVASQLGAAQTALDAARALLRDAVAEIDAAALAGRDVDVVLRARLRAALSHAAKTCREVLATCQLLASSSAIYTGNATERIVRDAEVALQHLILSPNHFDIRGRLMLGFDPGTPVV